LQWLEARPVAAPEWMPSGSPLSKISAAAVNVLWLLCAHTFSVTSAPRELAIHMDRTGDACLTH
jgi:hypothetical protein